MKFKIRFLQLGSLLILLTVAACSGANDQKKRSPGLLPSEHGSMSDGTEQVASSEVEHKQHYNLAENFAHKDIVILEEKYPVGEETKKELEKVVDAYLLLNDALADGNVVATDKATDLMLSEIEEVKPDKLDGKGSDAWKDHFSLYEDKLQEMRHIKGLEDKRSYFSHISEIMYCTIKSFGLREGNLYAVYCLLAFDGKGAYWIAEGRTIQNPYFGDKMPTCGEIKEEL